MYIISGMHRSGTSIVARLFFEAGADLGDPSTFYPGDRWNPDGYYEQPEIHSVNMPLVNGPWGKLSYIFLPGEEKIIKRAARYKDKIKELSSKYREKVVKETRFCLTFPAWIKYGLNPKKVIVNIREPIQVANSLKKRNHIPIKLGLKLWYEHNRRLLEYISEVPHIFLDYNSLLSPELSLLEFKNSLNFFNINLTDEKISMILKKCVRISMNHNRISEFKYEKNIYELWNYIRLKHEESRLI